MIIRATFKDNDFTQYLEEFFKYFLLNVGDIKKKYLLRDEDKNTTKEKLTEAKDNLVKFKEVSILIDEFRADLTDKGIEELDKETVKKYTNLVKEAILYYLESRFDKDDYKYLKKELLVALRRRLEPKWENGEVVYCVDSTQHITM